MTKFLTPSKLGRILSFWNKDKRLHNENKKLNNRVKMEMVNYVCLKTLYLNIVLKTAYVIILLFILE